MSAVSETWNSPKWSAALKMERRFQNYETKVLRKADSVICISETLKKEAISRGVNPEKITVVTNAVEKNMGENKSKSSSLKSAKEFSALTIKFM